MALIDAVNLFGESRILPGVPLGAPNASAFLMPESGAHLGPSFRGIVNPSSYRLVAFGAFNASEIYAYAQSVGSAATLGDIESLSGFAGAIVQNNGGTPSVTLVQTAEELIQTWQAQPTLYPYQNLSLANLP